MNDMTIALIGAGNLSRALVAGLVRGRSNPPKIWVADYAPEKREALRRQWGINVTENNSRAVLKSDIVILAVKPDDVEALCAEIRPAVQDRKPLVISVALGATVDCLTRWLGANSALVRVMPNTPVSVQAGVTGLYAADGVTDEQKNSAEKIFRSVGTVVWVSSEAEIDAIAAVSGCGPGYVFLLMEAIAEAAEQQGFDPAAARLLTTETFLGAARLALESDVPLADLRRQVTSPGGATEKAVALLEQSGVRQTLISAVSAAKKRCLEMTRQLADKENLR